LLGEALGGLAPNVAPVIPSPGENDTAARTGERGTPVSAPSPEARLQAPAPATADPDAPWGFRNKTHFVCGPAEDGVVIGHYAAGSHRIVAVEECPVHAVAGNQVAFALRDALNRAAVSAAGETLSGVARHSMARVGRSSGEVLLTLVATRNDNRLRTAVRHLLSSGVRLDGLYLNINDRPGPFLFGPTTRRLHGRDRMRERVAGVSFLVSAVSFFQTNVGAADRLVQHVLGLLAARGGSRVLDLYAGTGLFALPLALAGHRVLAVEESPYAVSDGEASRRFNRIDARACRFLRGRVETVVSRLEREHLRDPFDCFVLDPPRQGCSEALSQAVFQRLRPARVVYVSCNPAALAGDLRRAAAAGYRVESVQPVDMFPHTAHIESVAALRRASDDLRPSRRRGRQSR
jgi:23S rRNA (uracil1939-C5)-methyltransferase